MKKLSIYLILILIFFSISTCKKDPNSPVLPDVFIDIYLYPNTIDFVPDGGYIYFTTNSPSRGIIVYRLYHEQFMVYERICTYDPYACCTSTSPQVCSHLIVEPSGLTIQDTCCQSKFLITDGTPFDGPATYPLKQYQTEYDGEVLHIFN